MIGFQSDPGKSVPGGSYPCGGAVKGADVRKAPSGQYIKSNAGAV